MLKYFLSLREKKVGERMNRSRRCVHRNGSGSCGGGRNDAGERGVEVGVGGFGGGCGGVVVGRWWRWWCGGHDAEGLGIYHDL